MVSYSRKGSFEKSKMEKITKRKSKMKISTYLIILGFLITELVVAKSPQDEYPVIGKQIPSFWINGIVKGEIKLIHSEDLKGRYVILDFWHRYCATCIASMPKMELIAERFSDNLDVYMVGLEDDIGLEAFTKELMERLNIKHLTFAIDSSLFKRFVPGRAAPHLILINPDGTVKAITGSVDEIMVNEFIKDRPFNYLDLSYESQLSKQYYDRKKPFLLDGNGGEGFDIKYRSMFLEFIPNRMPMKLIPQYIENAINENQVFLEGVSDLMQLYRLAYFGYSTWSIGGKDSLLYKMYYYKPVLKVKDESKFKGDINSGKNYYWYSFYLLDGNFSREQLMNSLQKDLYLNFGYQVEVVDREMPYWRVTVDNEKFKNLVTKGGQMQWVLDGLNLYQKFVNYPLNEVIQKMFRDVYSKTDPIIVDSKFSSIPIDLELLQSVGNDFNTIKEELGRYGIIVQKNTKEFKVLLISDNTL
jgi:thiol-disulfide isomerase/thioredoxin